MVAIPHPLKQKSERFPILSESEKEELTIKLRNGSATEEEKTRLIEGHIRLTIRTINRYVRRCPYRADDLLSVGLLAIVYALNKAPEKLTDNNITAWILSRVHFHVRTYLTVDHTIPLLKSLRQKAQARNEKLLAPVQLPLTGQHLKQSKSSVFEMRDTLEACCNDNLDLEIVKLSLEGYTNTEISQILKTSNSSVICKRKQKIEEKFDNFYKEM